MSKNAKKPALNSRRKLELSDGSTVPLTLNHALLYQIRAERKDAYDKFNDFIIGGVKDYFKLVDVLYVAYLCGYLEEHGDTDGAMSDIDFMLALPEDANVVAEEAHGFGAVFVHLGGRQDAEHLAGHDHVVAAGFRRLERHAVAVPFLLEGGHELVAVQVAALAGGRGHHGAVGCVGANGLHVHEVSFLSGARPMLRPHAA